MSLIPLKDEKYGKAWLVNTEHPAFNEALKKQATKFDHEKPSFCMIPQEAMLEVAKVFTYGAKKYGEFNYSGEMNVTRYIDAAYRHMNQYLRGQDIDEAGTHHLANATASLLMALDGLKTGKAIDNRNKAYSE